MVDLADVIYVHSEYYWQRAEKVGAGDAPARSTRAESPSEPARPSSPEGAVVLFGEREGRIALANRKKDPLFLFSSLHRQLGYPEVPRMKPADQEKALLPQLARRLEQLETRLKILEEEQRGGLDLTQVLRAARRRSSRKSARARLPPSRSSAAGFADCHAVSVVPIK